MWMDLPVEEKEEYRKLILGFSSLTEAFAQKASSDSVPSPIINSKFQETVFQRVFRAFGEDVGNTAFDASLRLQDSSGKDKKYLIGIKTFGINSGDQKIAQFKTDFPEWSHILDIIRNNAIESDGSQATEEEINKKNYPLYLELAKKISEKRNKRIASAISNLQGFSIVEGVDEVESVYHVLMPSKKGDDPTIFVGETSYHPIDIQNIKIVGCTSAKNPTNFEFHDGNHRYKFTAADSQLYMDFDNSNIVLEKWNVVYEPDAFSFFYKLAPELNEKEGFSFDLINNLEGQFFQEEKNLEKTPKEKDIEENIRISPQNITESYSWKIPVERYSGFNSFFGVGSKLGKEQREHKLQLFYEKYKNLLDKEILDKVSGMLFQYLLGNSKGDKNSKNEKEELREKIIKVVKNVYHPDFYRDVRKLVFRPIDEMYIPIPNSKKFHTIHPDFFGSGIGTFKEDGKTLEKSKTECEFDLIFEPSGDRIRAFITQDTGKAIESCEKQSVLGKWLKQYVFQLEDYEPLTSERLEELGINGMRLYKLNNSDDVHLQFIDIDLSHLPSDYFGD